MSKIVTRYSLEMLETIISSKTRIKLLLKFFINSENEDYLRGLESEFGDSTNAIRLELNRLEDAGLLSAHFQGNRKLFKANPVHPIYNEVVSLVRKYVGLDRVVEEVISKIGELQCVYLTGKLAKGISSKVMDLLFVGDLDENYLVSLVKKAEKAIDKKIRYTICSPEEHKEIIKELVRDNALLVWGKGI
ncbi:MAG: ArsR family transcriptional regulator [Bacteroidetes bacterium]|nr:ArsR family transcriptional regulator [Bacteroidota bacterium]